MVDIFIKILVGMAGLINFVPIVGVLSRRKLEMLYGVDMSDPNLEILMRHRAVLFGLIGGFMIYAALTSTLLVWAIGAGLISMVSFIMLAKTAKARSSHIKKIVNADIIGILCLTVAVILMIL